MTWKKIYSYSLQNNLTLPFTAELLATYQRDCTEFEHSLVLQSGQVQQDVRHMLQDIGDELV